MYKINDIVTYGTTGVCKIIDIRKQKIGKKENLNVLIIGNSFSVDGTFYLDEIAEAARVSFNKIAVIIADIPAISRILRKISAISIPPFQ